MKLMVKITLLSIYITLFVPTTALAEAGYHDKVIVIGAGVSGLAAATQLTADGYDVIVLEARDRIGGRILSDHYNQYALDLGASWIHGLDENPIADIARDHGLELIIFDNEESFVFYDNDGKKIENMEKFEELYDGFADLYNQTRYKMSGDYVGHSLGDVYEEYSKDLSPEEKRYLDFGLVWNIEGDWAADVSEISLFYDRMGYKMPGREIIFPDGYDQIIDILKEGLDIRLLHTVEKIDYSKDGPIIVSTNKGNFEAQYVVNTVPLGVLKKDAIDFSPDLPKWKTEAIDALGMGILNKVYFVFKNQFWDDAAFIVHVSDKKGHWPYFANLVPLTKEPVLLAFNTATFGRELETKYGENNKLVVEEGLDVLRKIYGKDKVTKPLYTKVTRWDSDKYAGGSYSYLGENATNLHYYDMSKPVENRLFFAGEATEVRYPATVHGAYMSGIREAIRINAIATDQMALQQINSGILPEYVICKGDLELVLKAPDSSSAACVNPESKNALIKRGWACADDLEQILTTKYPNSLSCKTSLLTFDGYWED
jgi:monoamine oxidase